MSFEQIPVGATLARRYYAVITDSYSGGEHFESWDDAVIAAGRAYNERLASLNATLGGWGAPEEIIATARRSVYMETRIVMTWNADVDPHRMGGSIDMMVERHDDVTVLRTHASFAPMGR